MTKQRISTLGRAEFGPPPSINLGNGKPRARAKPDDKRAPKTIRDTQQPFSLRKRLTVLLAIIAVPAMAAPGDFGAIAGDAPVESSTQEVKLAARDAFAFEKPGMSFPGSAFYYLADPPNSALIALPDSNPKTGIAQSGREIGALIDVGPAARPFNTIGTGITRAQDCLAQAIWYEAASESEAGQRAVAQVVLNRVAHPSWPASVCGVVYEGSNRSTGCQFTFTCDGSLRRKASGKSWQRAQHIAQEALSGSVYAPIGHATHYHTLWVNPYWASSLDHIGTIGAHHFYRNRGSAGKKAAFTQNYAGSEPSVSQARNAAPPPLNANMIGTGNAGNNPSHTQDAALSRTLSDSMHPLSSERLANPALKNVGQVRKEFAKSGQWKVDPATLDLSVTPALDNAQTEQKGN